jgi:hypothetical protein
MAARVRLHKGDTMEERESTAGARPAPYPNDPHEDGLSPKARVLALLLRELGAPPGGILLVLEEEDQNLQTIPTDVHGMPAQTEPEVAGAQFVVTQSHARLSAESVREYLPDSGLFEFRSKGRNPDGTEVTMLHYIHVDAIRRVAARSQLDL